MEIHSAEDSRRDFIRGSSLLLASTLPAASAAANPNLAPIRVGLIGCGRRGIQVIREVIDSAPQRVRLAALGDVFPDRVQQASRSLNGLLGNAVSNPQPSDARAERFSGPHAAKQLLDRRLDLVVIATPARFKPSYAAAAVSSGSHVYMEQPCALDMAASARLKKTLEVAHESQLTVAIGNSAIASPVRFQDALAQLHAGTLGQILEIQAESNVPLPGLIPRKARQTEAEYQLRNWRHFPTLFGHATLFDQIRLVGLASAVMQRQPTGSELVEKTVTQTQIRCRFREGVSLCGRCSVDPALTGVRQGFRITTTQGVLDLMTGQFISANTNSTQSVAAPQLRPRLLDAAQVVGAILRKDAVDQQPSYQAIEIAGQVSQSIASTASSPTSFSETT